MVASSGSVSGCQERHLIGGILVLFVTSPLGVIKRAFIVTHVVCGHVLAVVVSLILSMPSSVNLAILRLGTFLLSASAIALC